MSALEGPALRCFAHAHTDLTDFAGSWVTCNKVVKKMMAQRAALVRRAMGRAAQLAPARAQSVTRAPAAPPHRLASSGPGAWISQLAPMVRQAFSWDMSVDRERVWFSFQEEGAEKLLASFRTAADSDFGGQSQCTLEVCCFCCVRACVRACACAQHRRVIAMMAEPGIGDPLRCCATVSFPDSTTTTQLTEHGSAVFSGHLSLALAHRSAQGAENEEGKESATVKQRLANWFAGQRPRTAKVCPTRRLRRQTPPAQHQYSSTCTTWTPKPQTPNPKQPKPVTVSGNPNMYVNVCYVTCIHPVTCMFVCVHTCYIYTCICTCKNMCSMHIHNHARTHTHTHTHIHALSLTHTHSGRVRGHGVFPACAPARH
jgi:hypothetical protein